MQCGSLLTWAMHEMSWSPSHMNLQRWEQTHRTWHHNVSRKRKEGNRRLSAQQSATSARQELDTFSILRDSQNYTTILEKHFNSQKWEGRGLTVRLPAPSLMPKLTVICYTRSQPWGYGHHPRGSRMQQRTHVNITRFLISTHSPSPNRFLENRWWRFHFWRLKD